MRDRGNLKKLSSFVVQDFEEWKLLGFFRVPQIRQSGDWWSSLWVLSFALIRVPFMLSILFLFLLLGPREWRSSCYYTIFSCSSFISTKFSFSCFYILFIFNSPSFRHFTSLFCIYPPSLFLFPYCSSHETSSLLVYFLIFPFFHLLNTPSSQSLSVFTFTLIPYPHLHNTSTFFDLVFSELWTIHL